jgi:GNAT superfamily N-acetyltransferase
MKWKERIADGEGVLCAEYTAEMCHSEVQIDGLYRFSDDPGGFGFIRSQFGCSEIWPIAVLHDIAVPPDLRFRGHGTKALERFVLAARERRARLGFLRVGWNGWVSERGLSEREWRIAWYQRNGWHLLRNRADHLVVPFMYRIIDP